jgi:hypothetical protein
MLMSRQRLSCGSVIKMNRDRLMKLLWGWRNCADRKGD